MAKFKDFFNGDTLKKIGGAASIVIAGIVGVAGALADMKKEKELENLKKDVEELKKK